MQVPSEWHLARLALCAECDAVQRNFRAGVVDVGDDHDGDEAVLRIEAVVLHPVGDQVPHAQAGAVEVSVVAQVVGNDDGATGGDGEIGLEAAVLGCDVEGGEDLSADVERVPEGGCTRLALVGLA